MQKLAIMPEKPKFTRVQYGSFSMELHVLKDNCIFFHNDVLVQGGTTGR